MEPDRPHSVDDEAHRPRPIRDFMVELFEYYRGHPEQLSTGSRRQVTPMPPSDIDDGLAQECHDMAWTLVQAFQNKCAII